MESAPSQFSSPRLSGGRVERNVRASSVPPATEVEGGPGRHLNVAGLHRVARATLRRSDMGAVVGQTAGLVATVQAL